MSEVNKILASAMQDTKVLDIVDSTLQMDFFKNVLSTINDGNLDLALKQFMGYMDMAVGSTDSPGIRDLDNVALQIFNLYAKHRINKATEMAVCYILFHLAENNIHKKQSNTKRSNIVDNFFYINDKDIKEQLKGKFDYDCIVRAIGRLKTSGVLISANLESYPGDRKKQNKTKEGLPYAVVPHKLIDHCFSLDHNDKTRKKIKDRLGHSSSLRDLLTHNKLYLTCLRNYHNTILFKDEKSKLPTVPTAYKTYSKWIIQKNKHKPKEIPHKIESFDLKGSDHKRIEYEKEEWLEDMREIAHINDMGEIVDHLNSKQEEREQKRKEEEKQSKKKN